ncbi:MAG: double-strand break repair helicase AddA [Methyloceanibacter sp.]
MNECHAPLPHAADANQARASDPSASAWVSANAGTGKTEVLVRRVLRLLLAGSEPQRILCLTYTKMAAAEMQNRLLQELAAWATMASETLRQSLAALLGRHTDEGEMQAARRLFAQTLEAKGGLKIYTIHGFCERLLRRFPLEADVTPHFAVLDEAEALRLRGAAFDATMARAAKERDGALGRALAKIVAVTVEDHFRKMVDAVFGKRAELSRMIALHGSVANWAEAEAESLKRLFGIGPEVTEATLTEAMANVLDNGAIDALLTSLEISGESRKDQDLRDDLQAVRTAVGAARVVALKPIFLTTQNNPRKSVCSKALRTASPQLCAALDAGQLKFAELDLKRAQTRCAEASGAVLLLADTIHTEYERVKRSQAVLDYDDLVLKTQALLSRAGAAAWVLFKIDGGIDHILVDEAQDTNPPQWSIIARLAEEFFAGKGASDRVRTLFAVGDEKQSIYSFQGAEPKRFGEVGRDFRARARAVGQDWNEVPLTLSFRSTEPILEAVDAVFNTLPATHGLNFGEAEIIEHQAFRKGQAGLVELWPVEAETKPEPAEAFEPWNDDAAPARAVDILCQRIAAQIKAWLDNGEELLSEGRKIRPGDILILVRRREPFTAPMIRALKHAKIAVAGADRMLLLQQIATMDLMSLADFLLMPEDDLALAIVLKSPLFGLDDDDLFALAFERGRTSLWDRLKAKSVEDKRFAEAADRLSRWLSRVDFAPPYEFFLELLGDDGQAMWKRMISRLGPEGSEALDEFLDLALAFDRESPPSLQGFVNDLRASEVEIKRDMEQKREEVRIMTVHGAKGLQAPIVFLPDTCMLPRRQGSSIYGLKRRGVPEDEVGHIVWAAGGNSLPHIEAAKAISREDEIAEYHRLLYVAMTRARDRLYLCGWSQKEAPERASWYEILEQGLRGYLTEAEGFDGKPVGRLVSEQEKAVKACAPSEAQTAAASLPDWAARPAPPERSREILMPSRLGPHLAEDAKAYAEQPPYGPKALVDNRRFTRGRLVHTLLQYLPQIMPAEQERAARAFVAVRGSDLPAEMLEEVVNETLAIVRDPSFAPIFSPGSFGEVPVVARFGEGENARELSGQIDRLAVLDEALLVLDYKTNRPPPATLEAVAPGYIAQLAAYRAALRIMFPERALRAAIVWTDGPKLMHIPSTLLDLAEQRILPEGPQP